MKKILITILLLSLTGCVRQESLGAKESILKGIDDNVIAIDKIDTKDGELKIENTDDNTDETFIIKSDKARYSLSDNKLDVILGITNTRDAEYGVIKLKYSKDEKIVFAGTYSTTTEIKIIENYQDVEVACPTKSASSTCYTNELVSTTSKEIIVDSWTSINLAKASDKTSILQKETIGKYDANEIRYFFPKGTTFIKITLEAVSTLTFKDEFYIEVFGENGGYGMLDPLIDNTTSYWKFDESSGNASDEVSSYTLTNYGTTPYATGKINNCANFNGSSQYFSKGSHLSEIEGGSYSISLWVNADAGQSGSVYPEVISQDQIGSRGMWFRFDNGMKLNWLQFFGADTKSITITNNLLTATWYHFVMVYEEVGAGTSKMTLYQDGSSTGTPVTDAPINPNSTSAKFMVGAWAVTNGTTIQDYLDGRVDEIGVWNRALSSSEVTELYNSGDGLQYPFSTGGGVISQASDIIVFEE